MKKIHYLICGSLALAGAALLLAGCAATSNQSNGARLWSQNCSRCHNNRSPASYSQAQWEVSMMHMRLRANLTRNEYRAILDFLQTASK